MRRYRQNDYYSNSQEELRELKDQIASRKVVIYYLWLKEKEDTAFLRQ
ncbi:hypothetical protein OTUT144_0674 [Orientia tsutsugamushi str. UT144]|uniref:Uncharacterized protein n=1 Tax=Orientia tsutsugamushi str. UT144 TaxID=1441384 RepID=A0A0F3RK78_ORITS|nr:hypothetical protein OTUT144_1627 [Orientia tsutsugamushi str. UT144]KJW06451.1 hypothetical protein OTUT144_1511 [Orientia tsutsugamushi str. UT144]KJW07288.1 hypothetical protein OTUT144_0674 [Orientia tsutsugamushi str. UT144]